jgi:fructokinase
MFLICGEALYDVFVDPLDTDVRRRVGLTAKAGGSPYNVAVALARLGCAASLVTEIAEDTLGRNLEIRLQLEGVDRQFIRRTAKQHSSCHGRRRCRGRTALHILRSR